MADINAQERFFSGQEVLVDDLAFDQNARQLQDQNRTFDFWTDGILRDPNGLSNMMVAVDGTTATLINVGQGVAYANGQRISVSYDLPFNPNFLTQTTNGICTQASSGNRGIPLASYVSGQPNYVWAQYVRQVSTGRTAVSFADGSLHYPNEYDGYGIFVTTQNAPGNTMGLTNSVFLGTVYGQGIGNNLISTAAGLTDFGKVYASIRPILPITSSVGNGVVRGSSANSGGVQREILQGTVSTPDLRDDAVSADKLKDTDSFTVANITATNDVTALHDVTATNILKANEINTNPTTTTLMVKAGAVMAYTGLPLAWAATLDATGNLNVLYDVNAGGGKLKEGGIAIIPTGTKMPFYQASVPAGWSAVIGVNNYFLRSVDNGAGGSVTGYTSPDAGFNLYHTHGMQNHTHGISSDGNHSHNLNTGAYRTGGGKGPVVTDSAGSSVDYLSGGANFGGYWLYSSTNSPGNHSHGGATQGPNTNSTDYGTVIGSTPYRFSYADVVIGQK